MTIKDHVGFESCFRVSEQEFLLELTVLLNETCSLYPNVPGHAIVAALDVVPKMHALLDPGERVAVQHNAGKVSLLVKIGYALCLTFCRVWICAEL